MPIRTWQSALDPAGPQAAHIAQLGWLLFIVTTVIGLLVLGALARSLFLGHRRALARPTVDDPRLEQRLGRGVAAALVITVLVLFGILVSSVWTSRLLASLEQPRAVTVEVYGHQFWWEMQYDDAIPQRRVVTANELHIPVGRPVVFRVTSRDVVHSFWVPMLHGKRDLLPGYTTALWLQADRPGVFQGQCAEFCGRQHAHMAFDVVAESNDDFERWLEQQRRPAQEPSDGKTQRGRDLFLSHRCSTCHNVSGTSANGLVGPDLTHVASRPTIGAGTLPMTHQALMRWIANPQADKPGNQMPPNPLPVEDLDALAAYLETLH
jgi:cytochrome c oxidase subunit 2